ncbi:MAG: hypothetical protein JWQ98_661 [Chlorobi bacterium]|jgi:hypothetical protein|nr:hypothetical protein [Chlorobiota bacterium]
MLRSLRVGIVVVCLSLAWMQTAFCGIEPRYSALHCRNGYGGAFVVMLIDTDTGCCALAYGVDCSGTFYRYSVIRAGRPGDSAEPYDIDQQGTTISGAPYMVRARIVDGVVTKIWGYDAAGYYEGFLN